MPDTTSAARHPFGISPRAAFWAGLVYHLFVVAALAWSASDHAWPRVAFFGSLVALSAPVVVLLTGILVLDDLPNRGWVKPDAAD